MPQFRFFLRIALFAFCAFTLFLSCAALTPSNTITLDTGAGGSIQPSTAMNDFPLVVDMLGTIVAVSEIRMKGLNFEGANALEFVLLDPNGRTYPLLRREGGSMVFDGDYAFDDTGLDNLSYLGSKVVPGSYKPDTILNERLYSVGLAGTWILRISNASSITVGSLGSWQMTLSY